MPCEIDYSEIFVEKLKGCSPQKRKNILDVLEKIKSLEEPNNLGGRYQKHLWAYAVPTSTALVCRIDNANNRVHVIDLIFQL